MRFGFGKANCITLMAAAVAVALALSTTPLPASAQALGENQTIVPTQEFFASGVGPLGTQVDFAEYVGSSSFFDGEETLILDFIGRSAVYLDPNGTTYNFVYQVENTTPTTPPPGFVSDSIGAFTIGAYPTEITTEIFYNQFGAFMEPGFYTSNEVPDFVDRTSGPASTLTFRFLPGLNDANDIGPSGRVDPGENSAIMIVRTNATSYSDVGVMAVIDGTTSYVPAFAPSAAGQFLVPEPGTVALAAGPLLIGAFGIIRRRRRRANKP